MTTEDSLLSHLLGRPGDGLARLAYADWLEEQGGPDEVALAELLRVRARLADLQAGDPLRPELADREAVLLRAHGAGWHTARRRRFLVTGFYTRARPHLCVGTIGH